VGIALLNILKIIEEEIYFIRLDIMAAFLQEMLIGFPFSSAAYLGEKSSHRYLPDPATQYTTSATSSNQGETYISFFFL